MGDAFYELKGMLMVRDGSNKLRDDYIWTIEIKLKHKAETIEIDSPDTEKLYIYIYIYFW